jgi:hypothetical protein
MRKTIVASTMMLLAILVVAGTAWASLTGPGVREGKNISVFHGSDFVAAFGYALGEDLTVDVFRNGVKIGTASGPARSTPEGPGLEVNHGIDIGTPQPGDCWEGITPDILPGDHVVVTDAAGATDEVLVDDVVITGGPEVDTSTPSEWDIVLKGRASYADGTPIPVEQLAAEMRQDEPRYEAAATTVERDPNVADGWVARYGSPHFANGSPYIARNREGLNAAAEKQAILNGNHEVGYGHIEPLPAETQLAELGAAGGPALGCEASTREENAAATTDDGIVNRASGDLQLNGVAAESTSAVRGSLSSSRGGTVPFDATASLSPNLEGQKTWTVTIPRAQLGGLNDGTLGTSVRYTVPDGAATKEVRGKELSLLKDTVAPRPAANPKAGTYKRSLSVTLKTAGGDDEIHFTQNGTRPTLDSRLFEGPIRVTKSQTIKAIAVDPAGNTSDAASFRYVIR